MAIAAPSITKKAKTVTTAANRQFLIYLPLPIRPSNMLFNIKIILSRLHPHKYFNLLAEFLLAILIRSIGKNIT